jgi:hypothetical protein
MNRREVFGIGLALIGMIGLAQAADKPDPTGTWKWTVSFNDQKFDVTGKFKLEGDKLTGTVTGRNNMEMKIDEGKFKDGEVAFSVTRERDGQKFISKYKGKVDGDQIKGTLERERNGEKTTDNWEAKREKST